MPLSSTKAASLAVALVLWLAAMPEEAAAQTGASPASEQANDVDAIVVWGTQVRSGDTIVEDYEIALKQPDHLSDLLNVIPGVQVAGAHSTVARINIRGLDDRDLVIYQDGVQQANYMWTHVGSILVSPDTLASVDVDLGTNGVEYGGLGGVVRFQTKSATDVLQAGERFAGRISTTYAANDAVGGALSAAARLTPDIDALAFVRYDARGNYRTGDGEVRPGTDTNTVAGLFKIGANLGNRHRLDLSYDMYRDRGDTAFFPDLSPKTSQTLAGGVLIPTRYDRDIVALNFRSELSQATNLQATFAYTNSLLRRDERPAAGIFGRGTLAEGRIQALSANLRGETRLDDHLPGATLSYGFELLSQETSFRADLVRELPSAEQQLTNTAAFATLRVPVSQAFSLHGGLRWTRHALQFGNDVEPVYDRLTYSLGAEATLTGGLELFADTTTLFKGPELNRPFSGGGLTKLDNPNLRPETGLNTQIGIRMNRDFGVGSLSLAATLFRTQIDDFILEARAPNRTDGAVTDLNVGRLEITGSELALRLTTPTLRANLSYAFANYDASGLDFGPYALSTADAVYAWREVGDTIVADLHYTIDPIGVELNWGSRFALRKRVFNGEVKPAYDVHDIFVRWRNVMGFPGLVLSVGAENLFDEAYAPHAGRTGTRQVDAGLLIFDDVAPGRNVRVSLEYSF